MTLSPFLPEWLLVAAAALIVIARSATMWRMLRQARGSARSAQLRRWGRWASVTAALLAVVLAAAGPVADGEDVVTATANQTKRIDPTGANLNVYLVVDRSISTLARDQGPGEGTARQSRLTAIRADSAALLEKFPEARFSVVDWGRSAEVEWPLSADRYTLGSTLHGLPAYDLGSVSPDGDIADARALFDVDRGAAAPLLRPMLDYQRTAYPERANVVVYFGCGEHDGVQRPQTSFGDVAGLFDGGVVLGYGTPAGGELLTNAGQGQHPVGMSSSGQGGPAPLVIKYDEGSMLRLADDLAVPYAHRQLGENASAVVAAITGPAKPRPDAQASATGFPLYWALLLLASVAGLAESYRFVRDRKRMAWVAKAVREGTA
ncbi:vWA domain-containing protein [Segniliparus rugosus]|uniref:VWFA domain-containing protein n=1 Tax=Segniliparus rugosus (strain ATCC BAA-974 / DSM 45345 / CCUG 50838 / CIP 108380 / JCM 13579 / CDC 945) TaxID=679197 RepID=E5XKK9_SEGRC|nr:VWA domain-containing protein [Segniliparus rugosus]EFV15121.1 hypothetical protein HMPREF9336_00028 [Segniliparus rugosus ATCC BAA-974]